MSKIIVIPAVKKNVAFDNDLVKKIAGVMLIQRALDLACELESKENIWVVTDSQEIELMCQRQGISCYKDSKLKLKEDVLLSISEIINEFSPSDHIVVLWPYCPLIKKEIIIHAWQTYLQSNNKPIISVKEQEVDFVQSDDGTLVPNQLNSQYVQMRAFIFISRKDINQPNLYLTPYIITQPYAEIRSFHDWWVVEKLINRKRILFRVVGNNQIGMGHIYRTLTLAHEVTHHEILFLCDTESDIALNKLAGYEYFLKICPQGQEVDNIIQLKPDLVINDILNTDADEIKRLKEANIKVVNFEDLGSGAQFANLVINELYDQPQYEGDHVCWGHQFSFLRDEFTDAQVRGFNNQVQTILLTFGGSDPTNLTLRVLKDISQFCIQNKLVVKIVCGTGYLYKDELCDYLEQISYSGFSCTFETGVISAIMENVEVAISSNGRTTYELAHMNIPSIILAHHPREHTHKFTVENNGFINLGVYDLLTNKGVVVETLESLLFDIEKRKQLFNSMERFNFLKNKEKVVKKILELL